MTPFKFDTEFRSDGEHLSLAAKARAKKSMTTEEIDQIRAKAHADGMTTGESRALEAVAQSVREMAQVLRQALQRSHAEIEQVREEAAELAFAVARKLAAVAVEAMPTSDVEQALREAMHQAIGEPRVVLRAGPRVIGALHDRIDEIAHEEGFEGRVIVSADPAFHGADCRIEWRGGGAERSEAAIDQALAELIARRFSRKEEQ